MTEKNKQDLSLVLDMAISSQDFNKIRFNDYSEKKYSPNAIGVGSTKHPKWMMR
jgi:hypothetical protein